MIRKKCYLAEVTPFFILCMSTYPFVIYPLSFKRISYIKPTVKEIYGVDPPSKVESSILAYFGLVGISYIMAGFISLLIYSMLSIIGMFIPDIDDYISTISGLSALASGFSCLLYGIYSIGEDNKTRHDLHKKSIEVYHRLQGQSKSNDVILAYKQKILKNTRSTYLNIDDTSRSKPGVSEVKFFNYIKDNCNPLIGSGFERGKSVDFDFDYFKYKSNLYIPDIIYKDEKLQFMIDIEIDEPYVGSSNKPIHYIMETGISRDKKRDDMFSNNHWTVIRFSEEQIVRHPQLCLKYIIDIINEIYSLSLQEPSTLLPKQRRWSQYEATKMSNEQERESYLNISFKKEIYIQKDISTDHDCDEYIPF